MVNGRVESELLRAFDPPVEGDPTHNLRKNVVLSGPTRLPDTCVGSIPDGGEMREQVSLHPPRFTIEFNFRLTGLIEGIHQLAIDVELQLGVGGIAETHG